MLARVISGLARRLGFRISRIHKDRDEAPGYTLYRYVKPDGSFDYERYKGIQEEGNKRKITNVWALEPNIAFLARYIQGRIPNPEFGICHGSRRGKEQEWFRKYLGCDVIGTDISETALQFPHSIVWDFHDVKPEWKASVDFIYSNSLDHSYDPEKAVDNWMSCLRPNGLCLLEHASQHEADQTSELDPFGADFTLMPFLIARWGKGKYGLREILPAPSIAHDARRINHFVLQRFPS